MCVWSSVAAWQRRGLQQVFYYTGVSLAWRLKSQNHGTQGLSPSSKVILISGYMPWSQLAPGLRGWRRREQVRLQLALQPPLHQLSPAVRFELSQIVGPELCWLRWTSGNKYYWNHKQQLAFNKRLLYVGITALNLLCHLIRTLPSPHPKKK